MKSPARRARARARAFEQDERVGMVDWCFGDRRMRVDPVGEYVDNEFNRGIACVMLRISVSTQCLCKGRCE